MQSCQSQHNADIVCLLGSLRTVPKSQRGKATQMMPAPATSKPQISSMHLLDIFGLPMLPDVPCQALPTTVQIKSEQLAFDVSAALPAHELHADVV